MQSVPEKGMCLHGSYFLKNSNRLVDIRAVFYFKKLKWWTSDVKQTGRTNGFFLTKQLDIRIR